MNTDDVSYYLLPKRNRLTIAHIVYATYVLAFILSVIDGINKGMFNFESPSEPKGGLPSLVAIVLSVFGILLNYIFGIGIKGSFIFDCFYDHQRSIFWGFYLRIIPFMICVSILFILTYLFIGHRFGFNTFTILYYSYLGGYAFAALTGWFKLISYHRALKEAEAL